MAASTKIAPLLPASISVVTKDPPSSASDPDSDCGYGDQDSLLLLNNDSGNEAESDDLVFKSGSKSIELAVPQKSPTTRRRRTTSSSAQNKIKTSDPPILRTLTRTIYTAGRPPWYDPAGQQVQPCVIGICGGSASGKTTVANKIIEALNVPWVTRLSMDSFYKVLSEEQHEKAARNEYNFDHPDAFDMDLMCEILKRLREGRRVEVPIYNFLTHSREAKSKTMYGANVIIFEGILAFYSQAVRSLMDICCFVDLDADTRLVRRLRRDISERGRDMMGVIKQYKDFVKPCFDQYILPQMAHADIIVPGQDNNVAINLIVMHAIGELQARGLRLREKLAEAFTASEPVPLPESLYLLAVTPQITGMHTILRNIETPRDEFIFYSKRLIRLLIEFGLSKLPFKDSIVETPQGILYKGKRTKSKICGVSILRAGETMEQALAEVCKDIRIGKILIQTNEKTGEPELYYLRLPSDIQDYQIMLMDATVGTGAAAMMAIRILLDHDVPEENIMLLSLLMAKSGVCSIAYAFPRVKIVSTAVDREINEKFHVVPGIGNFGDRYFGTEPCEYF